MRLSVVTTLYRSAPHLRQFHARIRAAVLALTTDYEIVFVNDGSPDDSLAVALAIRDDDPRVKVVDLSRNFGHHKAMMTGLAHAGGDLVFLIDCDLEEDPEWLGRFHDTLATTGADVVFGVQTARKGGWFERWSGAAFFRLFNWLSNYPIPPNLLTVRLMTRRYVQALVEHREREICISGLWVLTGFRQLPLEVTKKARGKTSYHLSRKIALMINAVTSFSTRPLYFIFGLGCAIVTLASAGILTLIVGRLFFGVFLEGWLSVMLSIWLLGGLTIFSIGLVGIYLAKTYVETKQRPYTIVREVYEHGNAGGEQLPTALGPRGRLLHHEAAPVRAGGPGR
jgi:putative glycosyltransferase